MLCVVCCVCGVLVCREIGACVESDRGSEPIEGLQVCQEDVGPGAACEEKRKREEKRRKEREGKERKEKIGGDWEGFTRTMVRDEELLE